MGAYIQVLTTTGTREHAGRVARAVVERRLAACVQVIGPISSTFWWQGEIETADEWLCLIKSTKRAYLALEEAIRSVHPYEVPEIMAVPVVAGSETYLAWLEEEIGGPE